MEDSPLWNIFSTLSAWERQEFKKFIDSPVYNESADVKTLFSILTNYIKQIKTPSSVLKIESLTREELYKLVYGENTIYNSNKLSDIMSALITCIEEYFIYKELNNNLLEKEIKLCRALRKRGLNRRFEKTLEDSRQ